MGGKTGLIPRRARYRAYGRWILADIFVSYSSSDLDRVEPLVAHLQSAGYSVWFDRQLHGGTVFSEKIESEVQQAKLVVVIWSNSSARSQWVADEAELGRNADKLIPVKLDAVDPPIGFRQIQTIDLAAWNGQPGDGALDALTRAIDHHMDSRAEAEVGATRGPSNAPAASIAVLPFVNMSSDPEQEFFSDGISEELLNLLARIKQMRVTARTSSFQFKGQNLDMTKIGEILGVAHLLEGSVRKAGNKVRITAQLIETATGFHMWSNTYDRTLDDIFAIQDEISAAIVEALKEHILGEVEVPEVVRSINLDAYEQYLLGQQFISSRTQRTIEQARTHFENAVALDPTYLPALVGLADAHLLLSRSYICYGSTPVAEARAQALPFLNQALKLDPNSAETWAAFSLYYDLGDDPDGAIRHAEKAIEINPNCSRAYRALGLVLKRSANPRALVIAIRQKVLLLDPASPTDLINLFGEFPHRGRFNEAAALLDKIEAIEPDSVFVDWGRYLIAWDRGNLKDGLAIYSRSNKLLRDRQWAFGFQETLTTFGYGSHVEHMDPGSALYIYCIHGLDAEADRIANGLAANSDLDPQNNVGPGLALWHVRHGHYEEAHRLLSADDEVDPDKWGRHFNLEDSCLGARLSWFVLRKLGDEKAARVFGNKLRELYAARLLDHEGVHKATHHIGACIAVMDGNREAALGEIEQQIQRSSGSSITIFYDPLLKELGDEPKFQEMMQRQQVHIASEKQAALAAGLLPPSQELIAVTRR